MPEDLTPAQRELYDWLADYIRSRRHSPSIRQMMEAMGLRSPAPIQSRLRHLQQKGWITWQEGQARTLQLLGGMTSGIPVLGAVAAGGLVETFDDVQERLDLAPVLDTRGLFALTVNGDSMVDAHIADGDVVLLEPVSDPQSPQGRHDRERPGARQRYHPQTLPPQRRHGHPRGGQPRLRTHRASG